MINLNLNDEMWDMDYIDHDRTIVRAIVYDDFGYLYFVNVNRDDDFGKCSVIETSGGGVEKNEDLSFAIKRELKEELGVDVEIIESLGIVSDYYNLIHRHNINNYYLCRIKEFGENNLTYDEINYFHLKTLKISYQEALKLYEENKNSKLGILIYNREKPILDYAIKILKAKKII